MKEIRVYFNDSLCVCWFSVLTGHKIFTGYTIKNSAGATFTPVTPCFLLPIWKFDIQRMFVQKGEALKTFLKNTKRYHYTLNEVTVVDDNIVSVLRIVAFAKSNVSTFTWRHMVSKKEGWSLQYFMYPLWGDFINSMYPVWGVLPVTFGIRLFAAILFEIRKYFQKLGGAVIRSHA